VLLLEKKIEIDEGGEYLRLIWIEKSGFTKKGFLDFSVEFAMNEFVKFENALHNIYSTWFFIFLLYLYFGLDFLLCYFYFFLIKFSIIFVIKIINQKKDRFFFVKKQKIILLIFLLQ
jgi:hypothetical protein